MVPTNHGKMHIIPAFILTTKSVQPFVLRAPALRQVTALTAFMLLKEKNSFFLLIRVKAVKAVTPLCRPALSTKRAPLIYPQLAIQEPSARKLTTNDPRPCDSYDPTTCDLKTCDPREARVQEARG